jgi:ribonuclease P protein component
MLKKENRLGRAGFSHYFKVGKKQHSEYLTLVTHPSPIFKASVVVGKKVYKNAVDRNKVRRRIYGEFSQIKQNQQIIIVIVKPTFSKLSKKVGTQIIKELLCVV